MLLHVASPKGVFEVSQVKGSDTYRVVEMQKNEPEAKNDVRLKTVGKVDPQADSRPGADSAARIDVMVLYSNNALTGEGSLPALKARINLGVTETNGGYANAGVTTRLRLVRIEKANYAESGSFDTDLDRLAGSSDGYIDTVHSLRTQYGADMVQMIIENTGYCGLANAIMATSANAFAVTSRSCTTGYYSFGHEFGHLQGARHDTYVDPTNTPYSYGHGYTNPSAGWRTIMAYNDKCASVGVNCTRLKYWSNPNKTYNSLPTGTSITKNYLVLNNTAATVANFKTQKIADNFSSSMNGTAGTTGWAAVAGTWTVGTSYYSTTGLASTRASAYHTGTYGDVTVTSQMRRTPAGSTQANAIMFGTQQTLTGTNRWSPSLMFQYTNSGSFSIYRVSATGTVTAVKDWTTSSAIVNGGWNTLTATSVNGSLKFVINGTTVWTGTTGAQRFGRVGVSCVPRRGGRHPAGQLLQRQHHTGGSGRSAR